MTTTKVRSSSQLFVDADLDVLTHKIVNLATPTANGDAATKLYVDGILAAQDAMVYRGVIDASANPNYPAANAGDTYKISVAGKVGGASGDSVSIGDMIVCTLDGSVAGTKAAVGANWDVIHVNAAAGTVISSAASPLDNQIVRLDSTTGSLIQNSLATIDDNGSINVPAGQTFKINGTAIATGSNTGDQTITLTSDVTGSGTGSFATTIASKAVTLAKMADLAANSIIGNNTGSGATPLALTVAQVKTLLSYTAADVSAVPTSRTVNSKALSADIVLGLASADFANQGTTTTVLHGNGAGNPAFGAIVTNDITDANVTLAKMANMATASLIYRKTAGTGVPEVNTLATLKTDLGLTGSNGGDQTITLTGDVTGSGTGSFATAIASGAVVLSDMANLPAYTVIGNNTAISAVPLALTKSQMQTLLNVADGANVCNAASVGSSIFGTAGKTPLVDADTIAITDSAASNALQKITWANFKLGIKTYTDTLYLPVALGTNFVVREAVSGVKNGVNTTFTLAHAPVAGSEELYLNGILLNVGAGNDYTISSLTITMLTGVIPVSTDVLLGSYRY